MVQYMIYTQNGLTWSIFGKNPKCCKISNLVFSITILWIFDIFTEPCGFIALIYDKLLNFHHKMALNQTQWAIDYGSSRCQLFAKKKNSKNSWAMENSMGEWWLLSYWPWLCRYSLLGCLWHTNRFRMCLFRLYQFDGAIVHYGAKEQIQSLSPGWSKSNSSSKTRCWNRIPFYVFNLWQYSWYP